MTNFCMAKHSINQRSVFFFLSKLITSAASVTVSYKFQVQFLRTQCLPVDETVINPLNAKLNLICNLLALLGAHHILHVSRIRVKVTELLSFFTHETK